METPQNRREVLAKKSNHSLLEILLKTYRPFVTSTLIPSMISNITNTHGDDKVLYTKILREFILGSYTIDIDDQKILITAILAPEDEYKAKKLRNQRAGRKPKKQLP